MSEKKYKKDPENYLQMSAPHENFDAAEKALKDFYEELGELRKRHKIRDMLCVVYDSYKNEDGEVGELMHHCSYGNSVNAIVMAAFVYGQEKKEKDELMSKLLAGKR